MIAIGIELESTEKLFEPFKIIDSNGFFNFIFEELYNEYKKKSKFEDLISCYIKIILFKSTQYFMLYKKDNTNIINQIVSYICNNYNKEITVQKLSEIYSVSPEHINRLFNQELNISPIKYINGVRIQIAKQLLTTTDYNISEISEQIGYTNVNYFWRLFKKETSLSPSEYKNKKANCTSLPHHLSNWATIIHLERQLGHKKMQETFEYIKDIIDMRTRLDAIPVGNLPVNATRARICKQILALISSKRQITRL